MTPIRPAFALLLLAAVLALAVGIRRGRSQRARLLRCPAACKCWDFKINCSSRGFRSVPSHLPTAARRISLRYNEITAIRRSDFRNLKQLRILQLQGNRIEMIEPGAFNGLLQLRRLRLNKNRLQHIPIGAFGSLPRLERLDLSHNRIKFIGKGSLPVAPRLRNLQLRHNAITCITESALKGFGELKALSLSGNNITTLHPAVFTRMAKLQSLRLSDNKLICDCRLSWLSNWLRQRPLVSKTVRCAQPRVLAGRDVAFVRQADFQCSADHNKLYPSQCTMAELPSCPAACTCQEDIVRCMNKGLTEIPEGIPLTVQELHLENNKITRLKPNALANFTKLRRLLLERNRISRLEPGVFNGLDNLYSLAISNNLIRELPVGIFKNLKLLQVIVLNANKISCLPADIFASMPHLGIISLYNNQIKSIANGTFNRPKQLVQLSLGKNPLVCDCNLRWLRDFVQDMRDVVQDTEAACAAPSRMRGKRLWRTPARKFRCRNGEVEATRNAGKCELFGECPQQCRCRNTSVDCSWARLGALPDHLPVATRHLKLDNNMIRAIPADSILNKLRDLETIDLSNNRISAVSAGSFRGNRKLLRLNLSGNKIGELEARMLAGLSELRVLQASSNKISCLNNDTFEETRQISMLSLSQNAIRCIMAGTFEPLKDLKALDLDMNPLHCNCHMKWLPSFAIAHIKAVKHALPHCQTPAQLMSTPVVSLRAQHFVCSRQGSSGCHGEPPCCKRDAVSCDLRAVCPSRCECEGTTVRCINKDLSDVPDQLPADTTHLFLSQNRLKQLNTTRLSRLRSLKLLDISHNKISGLTARMFANLTSLESLTVSFNQIECVDRMAFVGLGRLRVLILQGNNITSLPYGTLDHLTSLSTLGLNRNPIYCDCNVKWLIEFLQQRGLDQGLAECSGPPALAKKSIYHSRPDRFVCDADSNGSSSISSHQSQCNACRKNPCLHSGTCTPLSFDQFRCTCQHGYTGATCQLRMDACFGVPCHNNASCTALDNGQFRCECKRGFRGASCQENIDDCVGNKCRNNATCVDGVDGYTCRCQLGFSGTHCQTVIEYCRDYNPCTNGATCLTDDSTAYRCICAAGWEGRNCEVNTNDCHLPGICLNGGTCVDGVGSFKCLCRPGYSGQLCQTLELPAEIRRIMDLPSDLSPGICTYHNCLNAGRCEQVGNEYRCKCMPGYEGKKCEKLVQVGFYTDSFARVQVTSLMPHANITFSLATKQRHGIIMYAGTASSFLMMSLFDGFIRFSFSVGVQPGSNAYSFVRVNDGRFHSVSAIVWDAKLNVTVDAVTRTILAQAPRDVSPSIPGPVFVGALPTAKRLQVQSNANIKETFSFGGCVKSMHVNTRPVNFKLGIGNSQKLIEGCPSFAKKRNPCSKTSLCRNRGRCVPRPDLAAGYKCLCRPNYSGQRCQVKSCKRLVSRAFYTDPGTGCRSTRKLKIRRCSGTCSRRTGYCCQPKRTRRRNIRFRCPGGGQIVRPVVMVRRCGCKPCGRRNMPCLCG